jgi:hypothetical protein
MPTKLKPYSELSTCPKCQSWMGRVEVKYCNSIMCQFTEVYGEHMHRKCERCGYSWLEGCVEAQAEKTEPSTETPTLQPRRGVCNAPSSHRCCICIEEFCHYWHWCERGDVLT